MTLQEAMKSNLPFRRHEWGTYITCSGTEFTFASGERIRLTPEDILALDWELQEVSIRLTRSDFESHLRDLVWFQHVPTNDFLGTYESREQKLSKEARAYLTDLIFGIKYPSIK